MESGLDLFAMAAALTAAEAGDLALELDVAAQVVLLEELTGRARASGDLGKVLSVFHVGDVSAEEFRRRFHKESKPAVILGCTDTWDVEQLSLTRLSEAFASESFALYNGQAFTLGEYMKYCKGRAEADLRPLYVFEDLSLVAPSEPKARILTYYSAPMYFREDLFDLPNGNEVTPERPRFRWLLIGPKRSGTPLHRDPDGTSAWNSLLSGRKHWVLLPPTVELEKLRLDLEDFFCWYRDVLPGLIEDKEVEVFEFIQRPGETVFVPAGWWHAVINLELSVAVTQNLAAYSNARSVLRSFLHKEKWSIESRSFYSSLSASLRAMPPPGVTVSFVPQEFECSEEKFKWGLWSKNDKAWLTELKSRYLRNRLQLNCCRKQQTEGIPKIIHQIWLGPNPVPFKAEFIETWKRLHPQADGWQYKLWRDADVEKETFVAKSLKSAFLAAQNFGEKSDILRYHVLSKYGGIYVDVDFECLQSLDTLLQSPFTFICGFSNVNAVEINNGFIASIPGHPLLQSLINRVRSPVSPSKPSKLLASFLGEDEALTKHAFGDTWMGTIERTGPGLFTKTVMEHLLADESESSVLVLPQIMLYPAPNTAVQDLRRYCTEQTLALHHWKRTWQTDK